MLLRTISVETAEQTELNAALLCGFAIPASDRNFIAYSLNEQVDENDSRVYIASCSRPTTASAWAASTPTRPARRPSRCSASSSAKPPPATAGPATWPTTSSTCRTRPSPLAAGRTPLPGARARVGDEARHLRVPHGYGPALDGEEPCADVPPLVHEALFEDAAPDVLAADDADEAWTGRRSPSTSLRRRKTKLSQRPAASSPSCGRRRKRQCPRVGRQPSSRRMRSSPPR